MPSRHDTSFDDRGRRTPPWWKGDRGEWYLAVQSLLFLLVMFGPAALFGMPEPLLRYAGALRIAGAVVAAAGALLAIAGVLGLGRNLTPLPRPAKDAVLISTGAYRLVRHPIYSGIVFIAVGWGLWLHSTPKIVYAFLLLIFFDIKSRREERWLEEKFSDYAEYRKRVRRLVPFLY